MRRQKRTRSIGSKVTEEDYSRITAAAGDDGVSDWIRDIAVAATKTRVVNTCDWALAGVHTDVIELREEVRALRRILLTLCVNYFHGETITDHLMEAVIREADAKKLAHERLRSAIQTGA